jgi:hypothetical protein
VRVGAFIGRLAPSFCLDGLTGAQLSVSMPVVVETITMPGFFSRSMAARSR